MNTSIASLSIDGCAIRQDAASRYCINDLHRAAGAEKRHQPSNWLQIDQTKALIAEIEAGNPGKQIPGIPGISPIQAVATKQGPGGGTFVVKELVYGYAMWISPRFHLQVIRAFDAMVSSQRTEPPRSSSSPPPSTWGERLRRAAVLADHRALIDITMGRLLDGCPYTAPLAASTPAAAKPKGYDPVAYEDGIVAQIAAFLRAHPGERWTPNRLEETHGGLTKRFGVGQKRLRYIVRLALHRGALALDPETHALRVPSAAH